jgi:hypothetical protein
MWDMKKNRKAVRVLPWRVGMVSDETTRRASTLDVLKKANYRQNIYLFLRQKKI